MTDRTFLGRFSFRAAQTAPWSLVRAALVVFTSLAILPVTPSSGWAQTAATKLTTTSTTNLQSSGRVQAMKLVAPDVGWILQQNHLYWTQDNGQDWTNITPGGSQQQIEGAFFLNTTAGWALINGVGSDAFIQVASTTNSGHSWQIKAIGADVLQQVPNYAGAGPLFFVDTQHGWLVLHQVSSSNFSVGALLKTDNGGVAWTLLPSPPAAGSINFITPQIGWMAGGPMGDGLWRTEDGGKSWESSSIPQSALCSTCRVLYSLPQFLDENKGTLVADISSPAASNTETFITIDGGKSWTLSESYALAEVSTGGVGAQVVGSRVIRTVSGTSGVSVLAGTSRLASKLPAQLQPMGHLKTDFTDINTGWALYSVGTCTGFKTGCSHSSDLLSTKDGGRTYSVITPGASAPSNVVQTSSALTSESMSAEVNSTATLMASPMDTTSTTAYGISLNAGFDTSCVPTTANMDAWYQSSPYSDTSVYLGGTNASCKPAKNTYLNSAWITEVLGKGWGLIPIWVGLQSSCVTGCSSCAKMSTNAATAYTQGVAEADSALSAANALGITNGIITYDMEPYTESTACSVPVEQFLSGWVSEMHSASNNTFLAGIYDVHTNVVDFESVSPLPDEVWIAYLHGDAWYNPPLIFEISKYFTSAFWNYQTQAIMQYCQDGSGSGSTYYCSTYGGDGPWGGVKITIDGDVESGPVLYGTSTIAKTTPIITWSTPAAIMYGTALSAAQLNATASVDGTFAYQVKNQGTNASLVGLVEPGWFL